MQRNLYHISITLYYKKQNCMLQVSLISGERQLRESHTLFLYLSKIILCIIRAKMQRVEGFKGFGNGLSSKCPSRTPDWCISQIYVTTRVSQINRPTEARVRKFGGRRGLRRDRPGSACNVSNLFVTVGPDSSSTRHRGPRCPLIQIVSSRSNFRSQQRY